MEDGSWVLDGDRFFGGDRDFGGDWGFDGLIFAFVFAFLFAVTLAVTLPFEACGIDAHALTGAVKFSMKTGPVTGDRPGVRGVDCTGAGDDAGDWRAGD